jgi:sRNA-binding regulator protein Hfq
MKKSCFAFLSVTAIVLVTASSALATASVTTANASISADCTGGVYSNLTGPLITEGATADIGVGTIILNVAPGFQFNPAATVNVVTSRTGSGTSPLLTLNSETAAVTTTDITITVAAPDGGTARTVLTWSGIQVRPTAVSPLATNKMVLSTSSTIVITGIAKGTTNFGTLSESAGTAGTKLVFTTAPAVTNVAGVAMSNVVVQVQGSSGNNVASNNVAITVALNTGSFASGSTNATTGAGGSATFSNLVINTQGNYTLTASAPATGLSNSPAAPFVVVAGAPSTFQFLQDAPSSILAGTTFPSAVTVQLIDSFGNLISNKTVTLTLLGGGTLSGTTSQPSDGTGVATFGGLSVAQAGTNNALVASISSPSMSITGATFTVTAGAATKLGYTTAPAASTPAGVTMASIVVQIQDAAGNSISSNGVPITVALNAGGFTSGTTTILTAPNGSATFSDLVINTAGNYTLTASSAGNIFTATAPAPFTIATAAPSVIQITQDAPPMNNAGAVFSPAVTVLVTDSLANPATNTLVTLTLNGGGSLSGTVARATAVNGVATFNNLSISLAGTNYSLTAAIASPSLSVTGNTFVVTTAAATKLVYTTGPVATNTAGVTMPTFVVQVEDQFGNFIPTNGVSIAMGLNTGTFASGTTPVNTGAAGSASFGDLVITNAGNNTLMASATGLTSAASALTILPGTYAITFQQDAPSLTTAGVTFSPPVAIRIVDPFNNVLSNKTVTLSLNGGGTLNGTLSRASDTTGTATFTNLTINLVGTNYSLTAAITSPSLSVTGATFVVTYAAPTKLAYTGVPAVTNTAGSPLTNFVMQVQDQFNNSVPTNGVQITMTLSNGTFASGTTITNTDPTGSATIPDLVITNAGNNRVTASATGLTSTNKTLVILPALFTITFQQDAPSVTNAGAVFTPSVTVKIADQYSNFLTNRPVTMSLLNGGGSLFGTLVRTTAVNGVATFNDLNVHVPGTNYALIAISTNSLSVTGQTFTVTVGAASKLMYTTLPPSTAPAGSTLSTFVVQVEDQFSNFISGGGVPITLALNTGGFGSGTTNTVTDSDGSSTFFDIVINTAGTYTMTANSPGLTSAARLVTVTPSTAFNLAFVQQPPAVTNAGAVFTPAVTVKVTDQFSNPIGSMPVIVSLTGTGTVSGTLSQTTATNGIATFNNLSVNLPGTGDFLTAITTNPALSVNSANFNINVGPINHYLVSATTPQTRGTPFTVTVTAQDAANNTVNDSSTVVTMSGSTANVQFDSNGNSIFGETGDNKQVLSNGTFTISTIDNNPETMTVTATDANGKTGTSPSITVNAASGDYRSFATGNWNATNTWQTWNGSAWVGASTTPAGGAGTNITIQSTHTVTDNVAVGLAGTLITQGSLSFSGGSISVGSGGLVQNFGVINGTATNLIFNSGGTYQHAENGGTIPTAAYNSNSLLRVTGVTTTTVMLPTSGVNGNVEWNCPNQTVVGAIILNVSPQNIGGDFNVVSTGTGSIIDGGTSARNLIVGGSMHVLGGTYDAIGGNGSSAGNVAVSVAQNLTVSGGTFAMVFGQSGFSSASGALTVGGNLTIGGGTLTILTGTTSGSSGGSSMTVSGNTSVTAGLLNLTDATSGSASGVSATLRGNLTIGGGTVSRGGSLPATVNFGGTSPQTYSKSAGTISGTINFAVLQGATVNFGTSFLDGSSGTFTLNSGGAIGLGDPAGITTSGATGNIRVSGTRTYSTGGVYIYNGSASQATGSGLPATASSLIVSNTGGVVTLGANVSVTSNLTVSAGTFDLGSFTANRATSGGTLAVANGAALNIGGGNPFPTNYATDNLGANSTIVYEGSAQNMSALAYGNLTTSGSGIKSLLAGTTTLAGDLNIGVGTTFNAVTNSFSIAGNLTNSGTAFSFSGPQTVTFTGSGTQNVSGASAFNTFAIGSTSVINLDSSDSALQFTIAGLAQNGGTWGSTPSGATNPDDANFLGNGTLNVTPPTFGMTFLQDAPAVANAGAVFSPPVTVQLTSSATNLIVNQTVTLTLNSGTLNGTNASLTALTGTNGAVVFTNVFITVSGTNYALIASIANPSLSATGNTFVVTTAAATKLVYTSVPAITNTAGGTLSTFTVQIQDQFNNGIATNGVPITMSLSNGTFASGTTPINSDVNGTATFGDLVITNAGNNTLTASAPGLASVNRSLVILPAPYAITFQQDAPSVTNAGAVFTPAVAVRIADAFNNVLSNRTVTLSLLNGGTLNGTLSRTTTNNGVATFNNLSINVVGTNYSLVATSTNSLSVTGITFAVNAAPASKLVYSTPPVTTNTAGQMLPTFVVQVTDPFNNNIPTNGVPITMSLNTGTFASGTTPVNTAPDGSATFSDLVITNAGNNILTASATGLTSTNKAITILDTAISNIAFTQDAPSVTNAGAVFTPSVTVKVTDTLNNGISNATVTLSLNGGGTLNGTLTHATAGNGVATFNNLSINQPGNAYSLTASLTNSLSVTGNTFAISVGPISRYVVSAATPQTRGVPFGVTVTAQDVASNTVPDSSTVVTMSGSSVNVQFDSNGDSIFGQNGDNMQVLSNGTFTISTEDNIAETITVTATDGTGKTGTSPSIAVNAASGDFRSAATGNWNAIATWQTWNGSSWVAASTTPAGGAGTNITIQSTHTVTDNVAVGLTGALIAQGTATFSAGGSITVGSGGLVQNSGVVTNSSVSTLIFGAGSTYEHNFTTTAGTIPNATWNTNSTCEAIGYTTLDNSGGTPVIGGLSQAFGNFTWNCLSQSGTITTIGALNTVNGNFTMASSGTGLMRLGNNAAGNLAIAGNYSQTGGHFQITAALNRIVAVAGNFSLSGGTFDLTATGDGILNVAGNFSHTGGTLTESAVSSPFAVVVFNGTGIQNYTSGGTVSGTVNFNVSNNATLFMGTNFLGSGSSGTFTLSAGGTLGIGDPLGITTSGASGNVRVSGTRTYNTAANYIYNGPASQVTSNGLPATVSSLTVSNTGGIVTLGSNVSVTSNLTVSAGTFDLGSFTANRATSGGTLTVANAATLKIGGTNPFPTNYTTDNLGANSTIEYEGSAQNVLAQNYGNLTTSGSGTKSLLAGATSLAGELTIGPGTIFNAGTNNFSIAGDWTDDGNGFASSGSQTVTFNGASPQNVDDGTSLTTFNNVTINSNSVLNLAFTGSDNVQFLTIGGVTEPTGTWGATGSGATNIDNTHFQGTTGTLNVLASLTVPSSTTLGTSGSPATYGLPVTFTATVSGTGPVPTGTVTFMDGANTMGTGALNGSGQGLFVTNTLPAGLHLITAIYGGDVNFNGSTSGVLSQQISQAGLTVTGITANDKTYDGGTTAALNTGGATLVGVIGADNVTLNTGGAAGLFTDKNVGLGKTVNVSGLTISGPDSGNYALTQPTTNASIFALSISVTAATNSKTYDGSASATTLPTITTGSLQGTDITGFSETYGDKNVGTGKTLTPAGSVIDGNGGNNYNVTFFTSNTGAIGTRSITVTAATNTKPYDGTTSAAVLPTITTGSLQGTDTAGFSETYSDKIVATGKTLTPSGSVNDGNSGNNYVVTFLPNTTGVINAIALTVSATGVDKVYDGTTNATVTLSDNRLLGDNFTDSYTTASFADPNVGSNKTVSVSGIAITGTDATNYTANTTASTTANITLGSLTISADNKSKTAGLPNPTLTATYVGFVGGDGTNSLTTQVTLSTTATNNSPVGTYPITASGAASPNYTISYNSGTLTVVAVPQLTALSIVSNQFIFSFPTLSNQLYQVEYKNDMSAPTWTDLGSPLDGTGGSITITNAITGTKRFYQVDVMPGQ